MSPEDLVLPNPDLVHVCFGGPNRSALERAYLGLPALEPAVPGVMDYEPLPLATYHEYLAGLAKLEQVANVDYSRACMNARQAQARRELGLPDPMTIAVHLPTTPLPATPKPKA